MRKAKRESEHNLRAGNIDPSICGFDAEDVVLDAGTGAGHLLKTLSSSCRSVYATDITSDCLRRLRDSVPQDNLALAEADLRKMPFRPSCFTRVICTEVLEHLPDPRYAIAELHRVVATGGIVVVAVPTYVSEKLYGKLNRRYDRNQGQHLTILKRHQWLSLFKQEGLEHLAVRNENFVPALYWTFRNIFLIRHDASSGQVLENRLSDKVFWFATAVINTLTFGGFGRLGSSIFPKSWYFYLTKADESY